MPQDDNAELTERIIGAAIKVLNTLRPGLDEKLYERALLNLNITGLRTALLLNFRNARIGIKRVSRFNDDLVTDDPLELS